MSCLFKPWPSTWGRDEWLQWRRQGIGASDVAAICGLSTFASPLAVYLDKTGRLPEEPENESMRWGRLLERPILAEFEVETGLSVVAPQCLVVDPDHPWRRATLDGLVVESNAEWENELPDVELLLGVVEVKTTAEYAWDEDHGGIPDRVALQVYWQLGVAGLKQAWLAVLHQGRRLRTYEVDSDPKVFDALCATCDRFWEHNVLGLVEPPADSNPATTAALKAAYRDVAEGTHVALDEAALFLAREWLPAKQIAREAQSHVDHIENALRAALGDAEEGWDELGAVCTWREQRKGGSRLDEAALKAAHPAIYEAFRKPDETVRVLRPSKVLKEAVA